MNFEFVLEAGREVVMFSHEGNKPARLQEVYYTRTASDYDKMQVSGFDEHAMALGLLSSLVVQRGYTSVLDVGSGTGRALRYLKGNSGLHVRGIEPVSALREIGYTHGLAPEELTEGDARSLPFNDAAFDIVCSFGVLHHVKEHRRAVGEMCRVARRGVFISDANNFGQGSTLARGVKQAVRSLGLWPVLDRLRTRGRGYHYSEGDGIFYSYTIFDDLPVIKERFADVYWLGTKPSSHNLFRSARQIAIFATNESEA